ncbi:MAG: HAMP domain-containing protein, partial [Deltaproteobacteria bacterium]|nr:HAMP domain-containing protein [Deltaproteobacteria bacterium]
MRSARWKVLLATLAVLLLPALIVLLSSLSDARVDHRMRDRTADSARQVAALIADPGQRTPAAVARSIDRIAASYGVRIRVLDGDGEVAIDADREAGNPLVRAFGALFFGPDGAPSLTAFDRTLRPVAERAESAAALAGDGPIVDCRHVDAGRLLVCHTALAVDGADGRRLVYVQESSRRAIRALYDVRYQMLKLTLLTLPFALLLGLALGWRVVRPIERLREDVARRAQVAAPGADLDASRPDEVGELANSFNALLTALAERTRQNEAYLADLAHEFKNPVATLRASAERLADATLDPERARQLSGLMLRSCGRLDALITGLLELARAEAGLPDEQRQPVHLNQLARGLIEASRGDERWREVAIELVERSPEVVVPGVAARLETALRNLLDNALSFAGAGGRVELIIERGPDGASIAVSDSGPGISASDLPRVFDRFF